MYDFSSKKFVPNRGYGPKESKTTVAKTLNTGGKLELEKCYWVLAVWKWKKGNP